MAALAWKRKPCRHCHGLGFVDNIDGGELRRLRMDAGVTLRGAAKTFCRSAAYLCDVELNRRRATESLVAAYLAEFRRK